MNENVNLGGFSFDELMVGEINLDKREAAQRQIDAFVEMFFHEKDVVSQHTLVMAAHTILYDLAKKRGIGGSMREPGLGTPDEKKLFVDAFRLPENFFKHADKDPGSHQKFFPAVSPFIAMDAIRLYVLLDHEATRQMKMFLMWFQMRYPALLKFEPVETELKELRAKITTPVALKNFMRELLGHMEAVPPVSGSASDR